MNKSESIKGLATALAKAQAEMPTAKMNAVNPFLKNRYADLGSIIEAARDVLKDNGLSYSQLTVGGAEQIGITTILMHTSGEWLESTIMLPLGDSKGKSQAQEAGSTITYLRRYSLASMLGIYADEDTDGNAPSKSAGKPASKPEPQGKKTEPKTEAQASDNGKLGPTEFWLYVKENDVSKQIATSVLKEVNNDWAKALKVVQGQHTPPKK